MDMLAYELAPGKMKDPEQQEKLEIREQELREKHNEYIGGHPELRQLLNDFLSSTLLHKPDNVFEFASKYFAPFKKDGEDDEDLEGVDLGAHDDAAPAEEGGAGNEE
mmetsp:Transcript_55503/g.121561  ORF Transcript_55503/g.121561 Transcript_55503/m.121561 type:complete len:107 (+) Transcript_55503:54-374(+)